jgi:hypothetical protein
VICENPRHLLLFLPFLVPRLCIAPRFWLAPFFRRTPSFHRIPAFRRPSLIRLRSPRSQVSAIFWRHGAICAEKCQFHGDQPNLILKKELTHGKYAGTIQLNKNKQLSRSWQLNDCKMAVDAED